MVASVTDTARSYDGKCLCGAVRFRFVEPLGGVAHCHCSMCREAHGAPFVTWVVTFAERFEIVAGRDDLHWHASSQEAERGFCGRCGSTMFFRSSLCPGEIHVTRANVDTDLSLDPGSHVFWDEHVSWIEADASLPRVTIDEPGLERYKNRVDYRPPDE